MRIYVERQLQFPAGMNKYCYCWYCYQFNQFQSLHDFEHLQLFDVDMTLKSGQIHYKATNAHTQQASKKVITLNMLPSLARQLALQPDTDLIFLNSTQYISLNLLFL